MNVVGRYIIYSQICLYIGLFICVLLKPAGLTVNGGISYYGVFRLTIVPYCFGLLGAAYFCLKTAMKFDRPEIMVVKYAMSSISILLVGVVLTPDTLSIFIANLHEICGATLFIIQLLLSSWIIARTHYEYRVILLSFLELMAGFICFLYLAPKNGYLLEFQVIFQVCFGLLAVYSLPRFFDSKETVSS